MSFHFVTLQQICFYFTNNSLPLSLNPIQHISIEFSGNGHQLKLEEWEIGKWMINTILFQSIYAYILEYIPCTNFMKTYIISFSVKFPIPIRRLKSFSNKRIFRLFWAVFPKDFDNKDIRVKIRYKMYLIRKYKKI